MQPQTVTHVIQTHRVCELRKEHRNHVAPWTEAARPVCRSGAARQLSDQVRRNQIAQLSKDGELAPGWCELMFFHPCRVAGKFHSRQLFVSSYGMDVRIEHFALVIEMEILMRSCW
jgi:hypothetical protein